ncbi:MAG: glutamine-hydrolyzing carbamoyl-phosphate synthase small subunit [Candidatus Omnitrophica bacterium]|nr:glutamine-hydrolyzing carbamoyl-phosphate synthase small subunit [Candidatus Omnitrophota bacterium]
MKKGLFILEDGTAWEGVSRAASGEFAGGSIFYTGVVGYQELITDPAYSGDIVVMTYPHIGNCGINRKGFASDRVWAKGIIVKEISRMYSNWQAYEDLVTFAKKNKLFILSDVDTQNITKYLRIHGSMKGMLADGRASKKSLLSKLKSFRPSEKKVAEASCPKPYAWPAENKNVAPQIVVVDLGLNRESLNQLSALGCKITVLPFNAKTSEIISYNPDGIFLSGGPGDPALLTETIGHLQNLIPKKPILGVGLGFQVLCLALGAKSFRMKTGHYGLNQPVKNLVEGTCLSTKQNHLFAITADSLGPDIITTHLHLNDQTTEGITHKKLPLFGVQYCPGQADPVFSRFLKSLK